MSLSISLVQPLLRKIATSSATICRSRIAERSRIGQFANSFLNVLSFALEIIAHRASQRRVGDIVRGISCLREVASRDFVLSLRASLDALQTSPDCEMDGLIVADLKMQKGVVFDSTPISSEQCIRA